MKTAARTKKLSLIAGWQRDSDARIVTPRIATNTRRRKARRRKRASRRWRGSQIEAPSGRSQRRILAADRQMARLIDALAQVLARLEVRNVLARERDGLARLRVAPHARRPIVQRKAAEAADLDALAAGERLAH